MTPGRNSHLQNGIRNKVDTFHCDFSQLPDAWFEVLCRFFDDMADIIEPFEDTMIRVDAVERGPDGMLEIDMWTGDLDAVNRAQVMDAYDIAKRRCFTVDYLDRQ